MSKKIKVLLVIYTLFVFYILVKEIKNPTLWSMAVGFGAAILYGYYKYNKQSKKL